MQEAVDNVTSIKNPTTFFNYPESTPQLPCNRGRKNNIECFVEMTDKYFEQKFG